MQDYSIERVGQSDLVFNGELIGQSAGANPRVKIYLTKGGKFIGQLRFDSNRAHAAPFDKPADLINWLRGKLGNTITDEAQSAIEEAAKKDDSFRKFWTERVE